jgi:anti-sigma factor RsiW
MRCDEIQESFVDLLYDERGTPPASEELRAHLASCPDCRAELEGLRATRSSLQAWQDESPPRPIRLPVAAPAPATGGLRRLRPVRYAAIAAMLLLTVLALANSEIRWNKDGFHFSARLLSGSGADDVYSKSETRALLKNVLDESESRMLETNYLLLQRMMDTLEQERLSDIQKIREQVRRSGGKN